MAKTSFNENLALTLYHTHKNDTEIAKGVGSLTVTIRGWRRRKGLKNISPGARKRSTFPKARIINDQVRGGGVDYRTALEQDQAREMGQFLRSLLWAADKAKEAGVKPNLDIFMRAWIGLPIGEEGKRAQRRIVQEDYRRRHTARGCDNTEKLIRRSE